MKMATTSDNFWMPLTGPHPVSVGSSLSKALKARKGTAAPAKRSNLPDREFYSFRYNFKPESIDSTKPGTIEVIKGKESTSVTVERASTQPGEGQLFQGNEQNAKEWECVLIYDEELGTFTLEKLDSFVALQYDRKTTMNSNRPSESPRPTPSGSASPVKKTARDLDFGAQLEHELLGMDDAEGEPDDEFDKSPLKPSPVQGLKQEEEEGSEHEAGLRKPKAAKIASSHPSTATPTNSKPVVKTASRAAQVPKPSSSVTVPPTVAAAPKQSKHGDKGKGKAVKRVRKQASMDEEDLEFGKPARQAKIPRPSPPVPVHGIALPTVQPTARKSLALPSGGGSSNPPLASPLPPPPPKLPALTIVSDSEDEWDEVAAEPVPPPAVTVTLASDEPVQTVLAEESDEEEIDMNAFEAEMNKHLGEDDEEDFLARAVSPEPEPDASAASGIPMSLNQYAGGDVFGDDDYSSSSDDSD